MQSSKFICARLGERLDKLLLYAQQPQLWRLRQQGVGLATYLKLAKPAFQRLSVRAVLDVGAHTGQFALAARAAFPGAQILAFEPLPDCFAVLQRTKTGDASFLAFNCGLGRQQGEFAFERNDFTASSSFLRMTIRHQDEFTHTKRIQTIRVPVRRLDDAMAEAGVDGPLLVKIDVQGFEREVMQGGRATMARAAAAIIETSLETLYEGQPLFGDMLAFMGELGFSFGGTFDEITSPHDGRVLQMDAIFFRHAA